MSLPHTVTREYVLKALKWIDEHPDGVPGRRGVRKFALWQDGKDYPPKFVISKASELLGGGEFKGIF